MNRVKIITLLVHDQDAALDFYTRKVGFRVMEDKSFGETRWITIALPGQAETRVALELAVGAEDKAIVGKQTGSAALLALDTSDCIADYQRMKEVGVKFSGEPQSGPWGTGVSFDDLYGNKLFLSQEP
jgi:catechol 2,3-dioxygenase-like lactoylglutathione lyase family enzyme